MSPIEYLIEENSANVRIDRWYRQKILDLPQSLIEKMLRSGKILVNGRKIKSNYRLSLEDKVYLEQEQAACEKEQKFNQIDVKIIDSVKKSIIFENEEMIIINKAAKFAVQGGSKVKISIDDVLPFLADIRPKLVHRLDKETSGILLLAKNEQTARLLAKSFQEKIIKKKYYAIVNNVPKQPEGMIDNFIKKTLVDGKERMVECRENEGGGRAVTHYRILKILGPNHCLIEFRPVTGRTHQLRLHAEILRIPILGDKKYGLKLPRKDYQVNNLFLHAKSINLGEVFEKPIKIDTELPVYFDNFMKKFH